MNLKSLLDLPFLDGTFPLPLDAPFTTSMAAREGVPRGVLTELTNHALLRRPIKGVYLASQAGDSIELRARCLGLVVPTDCVICDRHAGWLHGAEMILAPNEHLALQPVSMFRPSGHGRLRNELSTSGERNLNEADVMEMHGLALTVPVRTAWDLGRLQRRDRAFAALDAMLRTGRFSKDELLADIERFKRMRGVCQLRVLAPHSDGRSESPGESVLRLRWLDCSLPTPEPQVKINRDGTEFARLDVGNPELRFAAEYDGAEWHSSDEQRRHDRARRAEIDRDFGWVIKPMVGSNIYGPRADYEPILREGVRQARARQARRIIV